MSHAMCISKIDDAFSKALSILRNQNYFHSSYYIMQVSR